MANETVGIESTWERSVYSKDIRYYTEYKKLFSKKGWILFIYAKNSTFFLLEYRPNLNEELKFVLLKFDVNAYYDRTIKDRAAKPVDMLSAIGGTMGLLTGFSIISGAEIIYFAVKLVLIALCKGCKKRREKKKP